MKKFIVLILLAILSCNDHCNEDTQKIIVLNQYIIRDNSTAKDRISYFSLMKKISYSSKIDSEKDDWLECIRNCVNSEDYKLVFLTCMDINDTLKTDLVDEIAWWEFGGENKYTLYSQSGKLKYTPLLLQTDSLTLKSNFSMEIERAFLDGMKGGMIEKDYNYFIKQYNNSKINIENIVLFCLVSNTFPFNIKGEVEIDSIVRNYL